MPFGLCNTSATQQQFIETVLSGLVWQCCFVYINDIFCYSSTFEQHLADLTKIFQRLKDNKLMLQPAKCLFCKLNFEILGFITTKDGLKPNLKKVEAMAVSCCSLFILLQETHVASEKDLNHFKNCLRKYLWFKNPFLKWK